MVGKLSLGTIFKSNIYSAIRIPKDSDIDFSVGNKVVLVPVSNSVIVVVDIDKIDNPGKIFLKGILDDLEDSNHTKILKKLVGDF